MNLDELNQQLFSLQNEFQSQPNTFSDANINSVNFQSPQSPIETTQIKRPSKTGDHRNEINDKLNAMNTIPFLSPDMISNPPNTMPTFTRNYTTNAQPKKNESLPQTNHFTSYYNHNFDTLQKNYEPPSSQHIQKQNSQQNSQQNPQQNSPYNIIMNTDSMSNVSAYNQIDKKSGIDFDINNPMKMYHQGQQQGQQQQRQHFQSQSTAYIMPDTESNNSNSNNNNSNNNNATHTNGLPMLNPLNMYNMTKSGQLDNTLNKYNESGYNKVEDKKTDYRQSMNNKLDNFIFNNPNALQPNPILQQTNIYNNYNDNENGQRKDTRMVIQESNKDYYRQSANDRMSTYSPLSRASNMPISIASMSVNDFYSGMQDGTSQQMQQQMQPTNKDAMNRRMEDYAPLAKTIQYQSQNNTQNNSQYKQTLSQVPQLQNNKMMQSQQQPNQWNPNDVNSLNGKLKNVVFKDLPVMSNLVK